MKKVTIGWATRDISTNKAVSIPGQFHARISEGVFDPVFVTALVIDSGDDLTIFVSADIVIIRHYLLDRLRERVIERDPSIPADKIVMNATHTHTGPSTYGDHPSSYYRKIRLRNLQPTYVKMLTKRRLECGGV